jgi:hypothetical protein
MPSKPSAAEPREAVLRLVPHRKPEDQQQQRLFCLLRAAT